jgi:membrane-associated phospholipid phosphatase
VQLRDRPLVALAAASLAGFVLLALAVRLLPGLGGADAQAARWFNGLDLGGGVGPLLVDASLYGREYFWAALLLVVFVGGDRRTRLVALGLFVLFLVGIAAGEATKMLVARDRPASEVLRVPPETDYSFPSGHALMVSIGAVYSLAVFRKKWLAALLTVEAAVVCVSRLYVGVHFPTDVLGGVLLGSAIALGGVALERRYLVSQAGRLRAFLAKLLGEGPLGV